MHTAVLRRPGASCIVQFHPPPLSVRLTVSTSAGEGGFGVVVQWIEEEGNIPTTEHWGQQSVVIQRGEKCTKKRVFVFCTAAVVLVWVAPLASPPPFAPCRDLSFSLAGSVATWDLAVMLGSHQRNILQVPVSNRTTTRTRS